ncbi:MAG TPA: hypothetical protein PKD70_06295 [Saprospiraceae bacterium]|mgnify:CR=1 FL=1|nr:hypothetical protein [Saprospiraceae bacterium]HMP13468.1 hypothetical protein [Saprospiraceae bacterium]
MDKNKNQKLFLLALLAFPLLAAARTKGAFGRNKNEGTPPPQAQNCNLKRGVRNNNPGNIPVGPFDYLGKVPLAQNTDFNCATQKIERRYEQFVTYAHGVRALTQLLIDQIYYNQNAFSIIEIVQKYPTVPPEMRVAYANAVATRVGIPVNEPLATTQSNILALVKAIAAIENGGDVINNSDYYKAIQIAPI